MSVIIDYDDWNCIKNALIDDPNARTVVHNIDEKLFQQRQVEREQDTLRRVCEYFGVDYFNYSFDDLQLVIEAMGYHKLIAVDDPFL